MIKPSSMMFVSSVAVVAAGCYYLTFGRAKMARWAPPVRVYFYFGFFFALVILLWAIVSMVLP